MSQQKLFEEFPPVSTETWEKTIQADLKGADYEKKLVWNTWEGVKVKPYYRAEDLQGLEWLTKNLPGEFPFARGAKQTTNDWEVRVELFDQDTAKVNASARRNADRGATALTLVSRPEKGVAVSKPEDLEALLAGVDLSRVAIHLDFGTRGVLAAQCLVALAEKTVGAAKLRGSIAFDPYAELALAGQSSMDGAAMAASIVEMAKTASKIPQLRPLVVQGHAWHDAGANAVQELGLVLASGVAMLDALTEGGYTAEQAAKAIGFSVSVGTNYFFEIAKLRALRLLWASILQQYGVTSVPAHIHCRTGRWNSTIYDPNTNMLRATTEAMSAVIGSCDALTVLPYDATFRTPDEFSYRIARNTQLVLKQEAGFDRHVDPIAGSYYVESITDALAAKGLAYFQSIEAKGGILAALVAGDVQKELADMLSKKLKAIQQRREFILGTNQYPNLAERMADRLEVTKTASIDQSAAKIAVNALLTERGAEVYERLRLQTEAFATRTGSAPKVYLWTAGSLALRLARATFVKNFFSCAGFTSIDTNGVPSVEAGIAEMQTHQPQIMVLCSSDIEYVDLAKEILPAVTKAFPKTIKVIAGYPEDQIEALKQAGADDFVHVRTNAIEFLTAYQAKLGVTQ